MRENDVTLGIPKTSYENSFRRSRANLQLNHENKTPENILQLEKLDFQTLLVKKNF